MIARLPAARATEPAEPVRRVVLIGFMGAGKSTVGALLARSIGWDFVDLDDEVARREGMPVHEIIGQRGVASFRRAESRVGRELLRCQDAVIAVGGGWPAQPGHMDMLGPGTVSVWLRVRTRTALGRIAASRTPRPLLQVDDPPAMAEDLLRTRTPHYRLGSIAVDTDDREPKDVVVEILKRIGPSASRLATAGTAAKGKEEDE